MEGFQHLPQIPTFWITAHLTALEALHWSGTLRWSAAPRFASGSFFGRGGVPLGDRIGTGSLFGE